MSDTLTGFTTEAELASFPTSEPTAPAPRASSVRRSPDGTVSVADLQSRAVAIEWYEALALIQALCTHLESYGDKADSLLIEPDAVLIDAKGTVSVARRRKGGAPTVHQVVDLFRMLLPDGHPPALSLAASASSSHSLEQWSKSLEYFERPHRNALIQAVYERTIHASIPQQAQEEQRVVSPPAPPRIERPVKRSDSRSQLGKVLMMLGGVVVAALSAAFVWAFQGQEAATPERMEPAVSLAKSAVAEIVSRIPAIAPPPAEIEAPFRPSVGGRWIQLYPDRRFLSIKPSIMLPITRSLPQPVPEMIFQPHVASAPGGVVARNSGLVPVYSAADDDVVPPVAVYPQFPSIPSGTNANDVAEFEVVVTQSGEVESVKARRLPASIAEALTVTMGLSAAKTWRFTPGLKNGEPVKYLKIISILKNR